MSTVSCLLLFAHHPERARYRFSNSSLHPEPPMGGSRAHRTRFYARAQFPSRLFSLSVPSLVSSAELLSKAALRCTTLEGQLQIGKELFHVFDQFANRMLVGGMPEVLGRQM